MLVLHALLVIFLVCISLCVDARPRRVEDVRQPDGIQKTGTGDAGIGQGYNRQQMEASPNTHLTPPLQYMPPPLTTFLPPPSHIASLHHKPTTIHLR
jgi:hypothetical protein